MNAFKQSIAIVFTCLFLSLGSIHAETPLPAQGGVALTAKEMYCMVFSIGIFLSLLVSPTACADQSDSTMDRASCTTLCSVAGGFWLACFTACMRECLRYVGCTQK